MSNDKKVPYVINSRTGGRLNSEEFLMQPEKAIFEMRRKLKDPEDQTKLLCCECSQPLNICGTPKGVKGIYFAHFANSGDCPYKLEKYTEEQIRAMKYNGAKESAKHREIKKFIEECLKQDSRFSDIKVEKNLYGQGLSKKWKRPDVSAKFLGHQIAFEIQLTTTFIDVIIQRENFYKNEKIFIIWFFSEKASSMTFSEKDIFYGNKCNGFILDDEAIKISKDRKKIHFTCLYEGLQVHQEKIIVQREYKVISFDDLKFDSLNYKLYYYDIKSEKLRLKSKIKSESLWYKKWKNGLTKNGWQNQSENTFLKKNKIIYLANPKLEDFQYDLFSKVDVLRAHVKHGGDGEVTVREITDQNAD